MKKPFTVALVQEGPIYYDLTASLTRACQLIDKAAEGGADMIVMGECWLSGYPAWIDHCPSMALWDHEPTKTVFRNMLTNSISVPGPETEVLSQRCAKHETGLCIGVNERILEGPGQGTMYNSLLIFDEKGRLGVHHRKLMPTFTEKLLYGTGDGHGLRSIEIKGVKVGGLICWEHWMPLARQTMHDAGEHLHIALWPTVHDLHQLASRHYAVEGRCFVAAIGQLMRAKEMPSGLEVSSTLQDKPNSFVLRGGSTVIGPDGRYVADPVFEQADIRWVKLELERIWEERMTLDTSGHYQRRDVFNFKHNDERL